MCNCRWDKKCEIHAKPTHSVVTAALLMAAGLILLGACSSTPHRCTYPKNGQVYCQQNENDRLWLPRR